MKNYVQPGNTLTFTATKAVSAGDGALQGALFGVASTNAEIGEQFEAQLVGVFDLPKLAGAIAAGAKVYWKSDTSAVTTTASGNQLIGAATVEAVDTAPTVHVRLNGVA